MCLPLIHCEHIEEEFTDINPQHGKLKPDGPQYTKYINIICCHCGRHRTIPKIDWIFREDSLLRW